MLSENPATRRPFPSVRQRLQWHSWKVAPNHFCSALLHDVIVASILTANDLIAVSEVAVVAPVVVRVRGVSVLPSQGTHFTGAVTRFGSGSASGCCTCEVTIEVQCEGVRSQCETFHFSVSIFRYTE